MKAYLVALLALVLISTAVSGLAPGGWDTLLPAALDFFSLNTH